MNRIKWFQAAMAEKFPDMTMDEFSASLGVEPSAFQKYIETGSGMPPFTVNVLHGILGATADEFVERGRLMSEPDQPALPAEISKSPVQSIDELLAKARAVLDGGGDQALTLRTVINLLKP